eukprot:g77185.t1
MHLPHYILLPSFIFLRVLSESPKMGDLAKYDLTRTLSKYMDRHMVWPLLEFLIEQKVFPEKDLLQAKAEVSFQANMVDATVEEYAKIYGGEKKIPEDLKERCAEKRSNVVKQLKTQKKACTPMLNALANAEIQNHIRTVLAMESDGPERMVTAFSTAIGSVPQISLKTVQEHVPEVTEEHVEALYSFAKLKYECGYYKEAVNMLTFYMKTTQADEARKFQALWGKVAAEILCHSFDQAFKDIKLLNFWIDERQNEDQHIQLERRMWLIHWSLFLLFSLKEEADRIACLHFLLKDRLFNTIQVSCPHVLRYLTAAMVVLRETEYKDKSFHEYLRVLKREEPHYSDPMTKFLLNLYVEFEYESIPQILKECEL